MPTPAPRPPYARQSPRRTPPPPKVSSGARFAGFLLLGLAALALVENALLARWIQIETDATQSYAQAVIGGLLGIALVQGGNGARKVALWLVGLGALALAVSIPTLSAITPEAARPITAMGLCGLLSVLGLLSLLIGQEHSAGRIAVSTFAVLVGAFGSVGAELWFLKAPERELRAIIKEWAGDERSYVDKKAGIELKLPESWVVLRPGNPLTPDAMAKAALGDSSVSAIALLHYVDGERFMSVDHYLDALYAAFQRIDPKLTQIDRKSVTVGRAPGRRMTFAWTTHGRRLQAVSTAWQDGPTYFALTGWTTKSLAGAATSHFSSLESGLVFDAPYATYVKDTVRRVTPACPMLSRSAVETLIVALPRGAASETFFRKGYEWAMRGSASLDPERVGQLRSITQALFASLGARDRDRVGAYLERVRGQQPTLPGEDREMSEMMRVAILRLPEDQQQRLRDVVEQALEFGRLL